MATMFKLGEAIELLKAVSEFRAHSPNVDDHIAQQVQQKLLDEVRGSLKSFEIGITEEARRDQ